MSHTVSARGAPIPVIPRSSNAQRIAENAHVFDFILSGDEMRRIANPVGRVPGGWD